MHPMTCPNGYLIGDTDKPACPMTCLNGYFLGDTDKLHAKTSSILCMAITIAVHPMTCPSDYLNMNICRKTRASSGMCNADRNSFCYAQGNYLGEMLAQVCQYWRHWGLVSRVAQPSVMRKRMPTVPQLTRTALGAHHSFGRVPLPKTTDFSAGAKPREWKGQSGL